MKGRKYKYTKKTGCDGRAGHGREVIQCKRIFRNAVGKVRRKGIERKRIERKRKEKE